MRSDPPHVQTLGRVRPDPALPPSKVMPMTAIASSAREMVLSLRGVTKSFGAQRALDSVDLEIQRGEIHAVVGQNGCGKSTLVKLLGGYHVPDAGSEATGVGEPLG